MPLNTLSANIDYGFVTIPLDNSLVSIKVWLLKNPFLNDVDLSGANMSLRSIFKFNNYRNFSLFDRLKYRSQFKFREFIKQQEEGFFLKAQINNDLMNNENNKDYSFFLGLDENIWFNYWRRQQAIKSDFKNKELLPLLSDLNALDNDESEDMEAEAEPESENFGKYDFEPSMVYFFLTRKRFLKFLKLPDTFFYDEKDFFLKLIGSDINVEARADSVFFSWFNSFYNKLFFKRRFFFKTIKKNVGYLKQKPLRHSLNMFFNDLDQIFDVKNMFRLFFFSLYNMAFLRVGPKTIMSVYRRFPYWSVYRWNKFMLNRLKFAFRKYRVVEHKFGSFVNFIYKNLLYYIKLFHWKLFKKKFKRFKLALISRRVDNKVKLPKPALTNKKRVLFIARKFYSLVMDKLGLRSFLVKFEKKKV